MTVHAREPAESEKARTAYRHALALATDLGMRPLIAHCHFGLGIMHANTGPRNEVREHLTTATMLYREMDMRFWLEKAQMEMGKRN